MDARELRIGNYVISKLAGLIQVQYIPANIDISNYEPIPLTEEWLIKFGFEKIYESEFRVKYDLEKDLRFGFNKNKSLKNTPEGLSFIGCTYTHIKYVHQLQNFYHALTSEELTLKQ